MHPVTLADQISSDGGEAKGCQLVAGTHNSGELSPSVLKSTHHFTLHISSLNFLALHIGN